ncbi:hypothetical protein AVEN_193764-1 [Araneus ventricosus]|uniref:Uncharacterized protein n=1 Tax=Araneus ventricosus TaxID=182803 RepID=A0A4Y2DKX1_ARAVE|nr:hypothetical protein AVEN_193764-1 [Araneus ventricosus]
MPVWGARFTVPCPAPRSVLSVPEKSHCLCIGITVDHYTYQEHRNSCNFVDNIPNQTSSFCQSVVSWPWTISKLTNEYCVAH